MGRSQTGGARDWATPSAKATVAVRKRWFKRLKVLLPTFFHLLAWRSQLYFKCYRLLTATLFHFHVPAKVIWGCISPLFGIEQTKLFFSFSCLTPPPTHTLSPPPPVCSFWCSQNLSCVLWEHMAVTSSDDCNYFFTTRHWWIVTSGVSGCPGAL